MAIPLPTPAHKAKPNSLTATNPTAPALPQDPGRSPTASGLAPEPDALLTARPDPTADLAPDPDPWVILATIVRPQGRHGELLADSETDFPELFDQRRLLHLRAPGTPPREVTLVSWRTHSTRLVFQFEGINTIEQADALRGCELLVPRSQRAPLEEGAVFYADLLGCTLFDRRSGQTAGTLLGVDRESANLDLFVLRPIGAQTGELLVPFAQAYEPHIDLAARRIEMTLPEGLLDLTPSDPPTPTPRKPKIHRSKKPR